MGTKAVRQKSHMTSVIKNICIANKLYNHLCSRSVHTYNVSCAQVIHWGYTEFKCGNWNSKSNKSFQAFLLILF